MPAGMFKNYIHKLRHAGWSYKMPLTFFREASAYLKSQLVQTQIVMICATQLGLRTNRKPFFLKGHIVFNFTWDLREKKEKNLRTT
jgi:hypothetical protein